MITNAKKMLINAKKNKYAVAHINTNNLEWTKAILETAQELKSPIIVGVSEGAIKYMGGFEIVANLVRTMDKELGITVPVAIHLDHGTYEGAIKAIKAGFSSVMFDGSSLPFDENLAKTKAIVKLAKKHKISVEAEVGGIGGEEDGVASEGELANSAQAKELVATGIDFLAAGIGNIHGLYPADWKGLNFDKLAEINEATNNIPLVLHGGTGIPADQISKAISLGISKINVNTELQVAFAQATRKYFEEELDKKAKGFDPRKVLKPGMQACREVVKEKLTLFGSVNKAK